MDSDFPVLINKVTSPHYVTPTLRRARLLDWLADKSDCRAIVINADAGYGKTTLLWQFEREAKFPCYWYKLDQTDRDWSFVITYLIESLRQRHERFGDRAIACFARWAAPAAAVLLLRPTSSAKCTSG